MMNDVIELLKIEMGVLRPKRKLLLAELKEYLDSGNYNSEAALKKARELQDITEDLVTFCRFMDDAMPLIKKILELFEANEKILQKYEKH